MYLGESTRSLWKTWPWISSGERKADSDSDYDAPSAVKLEADLHSGIQDGEETEE